MKVWEDYLDERGILTHIPGPPPYGDGTPSGGGDSINRLGHFWFCFLAYMKLDDPTPLRAMPKMPHGLNQAMLINWDAKEGCVIRHWKGYPDATDKQYGTSRDQFMPIAIASQLGFTPRGIHLLNYAVSHFGCMPNFKPLKGDFNGDFLLPDHWSSLIRACQYTKWYQYPIIWFGDLWRIGSVLVRIACLKRDGFDVGDSLNLIQELILGRIAKPNPLTKFACFLFKKYSPSTAQDQLDLYFAPTHAPPINECYRALTTRYL